MKTRKSFLGVALACGLVMSSCDQARDDGATGSAEAGTLQVAAVNEPPAYFARRIGGELVEAKCPAPADGDPAY